MEAFELGWNARDEAGTWFGVRVLLTGALCGVASLESPLRAEPWSPCGALVRDELFGVALMGSMEVELDLAGS